jgi:hypothetical protein
MLTSAADGSCAFSFALEKMHALCQESQSRGRITAASICVGVCFVAATWEVLVKFLAENVRVKKGCFTAS